jgi:hypothetical protein
LSDRLGTKVFCAIIGSNTGGFIEGGRANEAVHECGVSCGFVLGAMLVANILSVVAEAGFAWHLPDNPTRYLLFSR